MPIQYSGIIREHTAARRSAAIFDTCHMGEFLIKGRCAVADLEMILSCPVASLKVGRCRYGFICNEIGGAIDDQVLYRMAENDFFMVVNAATEASDFAWVKDHLSAGTQIENISEPTAKLDLQGPGSVKIINRLMAAPVTDMKFYAWAHNRYRGREVLVSRTGYTGEIGFEFYGPHDLGKAFWDDCLNLGAVTAGLGARDTLRLEMGFPLYGHELDEHTNAAESNINRAIGSGKRFIGSEAVFDPSKKQRQLAGIELEGRRAARQGDTITDAEGRTIGRITSGSFSPSLSRAIALGYVAVPSSAPGSAVRVRSDRQELAGTIAELPFYKQATGRAEIKGFL
jgi:aminomethyltransferase